MTLQEIIDIEKWEAKQEGIQEGKEEGKQEGIAESKAAIAKSLKENGADLELIVKCTGLTKEEIEAL